MKTFLISIVSVVGLFVAATAVMFVFKACPPQGPWPSPRGAERTVIKLKFQKFLFPNFKLLLLVLRQLQINQRQSPLPLLLYILLSKFPKIRQTIQ